MHKTSWTKGASSLPSDRLRPKKNNQQKQGQQKSKTQQQQSGVVGGQKSKAVRELESLIANLQSHITPVRDPKGGCFCLAREHVLSPYIPLCTSCGLILCKLNKPHHTCPHCGSAEGLLTPSQRTSLLTQLRETLDSTLAREEADRLRQIEEAKKAAGAFPSLASTITTNPSLIGSTNQKIAAPTPSRPTQTSSEPHKVLSLTNTKSKSGRKVVTVSSYTSTPNSSRPATPSSINSITETTDEPENRVPPPPSQTVNYVANRRVNPSRPWQNFSDDIRYVPPPEAAVPPTDSEKPKSRKKGKGKGGGDGSA